MTAACSLHAHNGMSGGWNAYEAKASDRAAQDRARKRREYSQLRIYHKYARYVVTAKTMTRASIPRTNAEMKTMTMLPMNTVGHKEGTYRHLR